MLKKQAQVFLTLLFLMDLSLVWICWILAYYLRFSWIDWPESSSTPEMRQYLRASAVVVILASICFVKGKMYHPKRLSRFKAETRAILRSNAMLFVMLLGATFFYRKFSFSRVHSLYFLTLAVSSIFSFRLVVRLVLESLRKKGKNLRRILVIGSGHTALNFSHKIEENRSLGFKIVGFIAVQPEDSQLPTYEYLGNYAALPQVIEKYQVDQVYIALDSNQQSDLQEINHHLAEQVVDLNIVPDIFHTLNINPEILELDGLPIIALRQSPMDAWGRILKRSLDLVGGGLVTLMLLPMWIILPILIKLSSPGPIFYRQERMGLDGKKFKMIKFRSMRADAEQNSGAVWAVKNDNRTTALGQFMRKTSLDEFPQLFNVLSGSMSLVGPRPERPVFIEEFKSQIPNYMLRHKMKAGMTGWAQINGWRGNTSLEKRIECDIYYLTHWSILFDIKIGFLTFFKGFVHPNAY